MLERRHETNALGSLRDVHVKVQEHCPCGESSTVAATESILNDSGEKSSVERCVGTRWLGRGMSDEVPRQARNVPCALEREVRQSKRQEPVRALVDHAVAAQVERACDGGDAMHDGVLAKEDDLAGCRDDEPVDCLRRRLEA